eukprot:gene4722-5170_t
MEPSAPRYWQLPASLNLLEGMVDAQPPAVLVDEGSTKSLKLEHKLFVGASAGIFGTSLIYPLDMLKTKLQSATTRISITHFSSILRQAVQTGGLYRGFSACLVGIAPEKAIKLAVNDTIREEFTRGLRPIRTWEEIVAGTTAGFLQLFVTVPYEGVKIRLQMSTDRAISAFSILRSLKSPLDVYRGFTATFCRDVPFCFLYFPLYANIKEAQMKHFYANELEEPFHVGLVAGILAGAVAAVAVTPADMLKTRIQQGLNGSSSFWAYGQEVMKKEGLSALFKGWQARVMVIAPLYGIVSLAFEVQKRWLGL